jgi:hypothetical protein
MLECKPRCPHELLLERAGVFEQKFLVRYRGPKKIEYTDLKLETVIRNDANQPAFFSFLFLVPVKCWWIKSRSANQPAVFFLLSEAKQNGSLIQMYPYSLFSQWQPLNPLRRAGISKAVQECTHSLIQMSSLSVISRMIA